MQALGRTLLILLPPKRTETEGGIAVVQETADGEDVRYGMVISIGGQAREFAGDLLPLDPAVVEGSIVSFDTAFRSFLVYDDVQAKAMWADGTMRGIIAVPPEGLVTLIKDEELKANRLIYDFEVERATLRAAVDAG